MKKRFVFVNLSINCGYNSGMNHGIAFLIPIVKKYNYDVSCLNIRKEIRAEDFADKIKELNPDIVAFSTNSHQLKYLMKYSTALWDFPGMLQLAGGVGSTLDPETVLLKSMVKGVCVGEGEIPLNKLLNNIEKGNDIYDTEGFYWRIDGRIRKNVIPQFIADLSDIDLPDHTVFEDNVVGADRMVSIMVSRGCPYNCYFCCNVALSSVYPSSKGYFRILPVEKSIRIVENVLKQCPQIEFVHFEDDLLIANKEWFLNFADQYRKRIKLPYRVCVRVECVTKEIVEALKESGCKLVFLGLESGDESFRSQFLNRKYTNNMLIKKSKLIKDAGIRLFTFNIVGFPCEGKEQMLNTYNLNKSVNPDSGVCTFFYPYKNTELYRICQEKDLLIDEKDLLEITNYNTKPAIKMTKQQEGECIAIQRKLLNYLLNRKELVEIRDLPFSLKKYLKVLRHWVKSLLRTSPFLDNLIRGTYFSLKLKILSVAGLTAARYKNRVMI